LEVSNWVRQFLETGSVAPAKIGGYRQKTLRGAHRDWLLGRINEKDFTIRGLVVELESERGLKVDYKTMWTFLHDEGLSFKKKRGGQRARASRHRPAP
jgi:putative transposase